MISRNSFGDRASHLKQLVFPDIFSLPKCSAIYHLCFSYGSFYKILLKVHGILGCKSHLSVGVLIVFLLFIQNIFFD